MNSEDWLEVLRQRYEAGQTDALLDAVGICISKPIVAPEWVQRAFNIAWHIRYADCQVRDLGEAFEIERPNGFDIRTGRKRTKRFMIWQRITQLQREGKSLTQAYGIAADEFAINEKDVRELYRSVKNLAKHK